MPGRSPSVSFWVIALILVLACAACGGRSSDSASEPAAAPVVTPAGDPSPSSVAAVAYPLTVPRSDGHTVTLRTAPRRIVSLSPGMTEILFAIGAGGQIVGVDRFSDYPDAARALPTVEYSNPNLEAVAALRPDLLILGGRQIAQAAVFEQAGLPVLLLDEPGSVRGVLERVRLLGQVTDHAAPAEALATAMERRMADVTARLSDVATGPRVYHELDAALYSAAPNSFLGDLYALLKARTIAPAGSNPYPRLSAEAIIQADPEVIILTNADFSGGSPAEVRARPGWATIAAVKTNRIYPMNGDLVSRPGPRIVEGLEQLARVLYPERFP